MKITDKVISDFFGKSKGFAVKSIKRWGGFIKNDEDLDAAIYHAVNHLVSARNREIEFENEVHMINYMMRCCYWGWCTALTKNKKDLLVFESELIPAGADEDFKNPKISEPSCEMPEAGATGAFSLQQRLTEMVRHKLGQRSAEIFERTIAGEEPVKNLAIEFECRVSWIEDRRKIIKRYLSRKTLNYATLSGYRKNRIEDTIGVIQNI